VKPDFLLPFCEHAPTQMCVKSSVYADPAYLRTPLGFWNVLVHRGVFYGSQFALEHDTNFESLEAWQAIWGSSAFINKADHYFCNGNAYGPNNFW
jgi:hypothetical protein